MQILWKIKGTNSSTLKIGCDIYVTVAYKHVNMEFCWPRKKKNKQTKDHLGLHEQIHTLTTYFNINFNIILPSVTQDVHTQHFICISIFSHVECLKIREWEL